MGKVRVPGKVRGRGRKAPKVRDPFAEELTGEELPDLPESLWDSGDPALPAEVDAASGEHEWEPVETVQGVARSGSDQAANEFRGLALSGRVVAYRCRKCGTSVLIPPSVDLDLSEFDGSVPTCSELLIDEVHDL